MRYILTCLTLLFISCLSAQTIRVMSYNIHHANPPSKPGFIDLDAIAKVINDADVDAVGIQEVDIKVSRSNLENQATKLAELTNMDYYFSKGINLEKGAYGTLILTKHKIVGKRRYDLPMVVKSENRSLAIVDIELPSGKSFSIANTHLDLKEENKIAQAQYINELGELYSRPLILVGDLNAEPDTKPIRILEEFFERFSKKKVPTFPNVNASKEIDYIMVSKHSKFKWKKYHTIDEPYASDHLPLVAEIKLKK